MTLAWILETTLRTVIVTGLAGLGLALFQVRSSTVKLAVWRLVLLSSLLMPLVSLLPKRRALVLPRPTPAVARVIWQLNVPPAPIKQFGVNRTSFTSSPVDWQTLVFRSYALIAGLLALRTALGLLRLRQIGVYARPMPELGLEVFETEMVSVPVTYGVFHPRILLPVDWRVWTSETLGAVLAHERSHIAERDFLTQLLSKINRAMYWPNPLAWWLVRQLAELAEQISDDAALNRVGERPTYAAMLLHFAARRANFASAAGVAMARPGGVSGRIDRILDDAHRVSGPLAAGVRLALAAVAFVTVLVIGAFRLTTVSSAQTNPPPSRAHNVELWQDSDNDHNEWALVTPNGTISMNLRGDIKRRLKALKLHNSGNYLWFTRDRQEFVIDNAHILDEIRAAFEPLDELSRQQSELGEQQSALGDQMSKLGDEMSRLSDKMSRITVGVPDQGKLRSQVAELNKLASELDSRHKDLTVDEVSNLQGRLGDLQSLIGQAQSLAGEKQSKMGELQSKIGDKQALLGEKQGKLGELQGRLGDRQAQVSKQAEQMLRQLIDRAIQDGTAKPAR